MGRGGSWEARASSWLCVAVSHGYEAKDDCTLTDG